MNWINTESLIKYNYLIVLAAILLATKLLGLLTRKVRMPQVVGALIAGVILGPVFNAITGCTTETGFFSSAAGSDQLFGKLSELGVVVLMFGAGLETDIHEMKKCGKAAFVIASAGVIVPLLLGTTVSWFFVKDPDSSVKILKSIFIGVILTATSVSITVETLKEMGKLSTHSGSAILGAAIIDDVLGIVALTVISSFADKSVNIAVVLIKILLFFVFSVLCGILMYAIFKRMNKSVKRDSRRYVIIAFVYCLVVSFCAEVFFGVADITGAYIAGLVLSMTNRRKYLDDRFSTLSYMLLSPIFFAGIGLTIELPSLTLSLMIFAAVLTVTAIASKFCGCALGGKICGYGTRECFQIGAGMAARGEVALIVAKKGELCGLMDPAFFGPVVIMVVITAITAPIFLKYFFKSTPQGNTAADSAV